MTLSLTPITPGTLTLTGTATGSIAIGPVFTVTDGSTSVTQPGTLKFSGATVTESPAGTALVTITGGTSPIETTEIVLTNAQIKALHTTPIEIVAPDDASHVPILSDVTLVIDDTNGLYTDPDGPFVYSTVIGYGPDPTITAQIIMDQIALDDAGMGAPGPGVWPAWAGVHGFKNFTAGWYWGTVGPLAPFGSVATPTGSIMVGKSGAANYTGGGTGNTLTIRVQYSQVKISV